MFLNFISDGQKVLHPYVLHPPVALPYLHNGDRQPTVSEQVHPRPRSRSNQRPRGSPHTTRWGWKRVASNVISWGSTERTRKCARCPSKADATSLRRAASSKANSTRICIFRSSLAHAASSHRPVVQEGRTRSPEK